MLLQSFSEGLSGPFLRTVGVLVFSWLAIVVALAFVERHLIYFPTRAVSVEPADFGLRADELSITTPDGVLLHGWWIKGSSGRVLVWYHGNAGNIGDRLGNARWFVDRFGLDVVLVDYRGYGRSSGTPAEDGLYLDGLAIYDAVTARSVSEENIVLFGRSLGAAVAIETALKRPVGAVVLESAFRSIPALARRHYPFVPSVLIRTRMDNESRIAELAAPTLFFHGACDGIVPVAHGRRLFELARSALGLHVIQGAGHNNAPVVGGELYAEAWAVFLRQTAPLPADGASD